MCCLPLVWTKSAPSSSPKQHRHIHKYRKYRNKVDSFFLPISSHLPPTLIPFLIQNCLNRRIPSKNFPDIFAGCTVTQLVLLRFRPDFLINFRIKAMLLEVPTSNGRSISEHHFWSPWLLWTVSVFYVAFNRNIRYSLCTQDSLCAFYLSCWHRNSELNLPDLLVSVLKIKVKNQG